MIIRQNLWKLMMIFLAKLMLSGCLTPLSLLVRHYRMKCREWDSSLMNAGNMLKTSSILR